MFKKVINTVLLIAAVTPMAAQAANVKKSRWDGVYIAAGGGGTVSAKKIQVLNSKNLYDKQKLASHSALRAEIGKSFMGDFRMGFEYVALPSSKETFNDSTDATKQITGTITSMAGFVNFYYDMHDAGSTITPYLGFGVGMARNKMDDLVSNWVYPSGGPLATGNYTFVKKFINGVAWKGMLGVKLNMSDMLYVDIGYSYANFGRLRAYLQYSGSATATPTVTSTGYSTLLDKTNLRQHVGTVSLALQF